MEQNTKMKNNNKKKAKEKDDKLKKVRWQTSV